MATAEVRAGMKASKARMRVMVRSAWAPASATSKPVAFRRTPPPARAAAIPSFTTHQKMDPYIPSRR